MFHLIFSGPERAAAALVETLEAEGFPAQIAGPGHGFDPEPLRLFVEALGDPSLVDEASTLATSHGFHLRLHAVVQAPTFAAPSPLEARVAELEARLVSIEGAR